MIDTFMLQINIYKEIIESSQQEESQEREINLPTIFSLAMDRKAHDFLSDKGDLKTINKNWSPEELKFLLKLTDRLIEKNNIFAKLYDSIEVKLDDSNDLVVESKIPGFLNFIDDEDENSDNTYFEKRRIELESSLINICISFESYISNLLKDIYINYTDATALMKKNLTFEELLKIGNIDSAKEFIVDSHIDDLFRNSFSNWMTETVKAFSASSKFELNSNIFQSVNELYQRRNLFVHTSGIVNDYYIKNVANTNLKSGDKIIIDEEYLNQKINDIVKLAWLIYDVYLHKKLQDKGSAFNILNSKIIKYINSGYDVIGEIFDKYARERLPEEDQSINKMAKVNYFLYYKLNGKFEDVRTEVEKFNVTYLSEDFKVAKKILLESGDYLIDVEKHIDSLNESDFFSEINWPIFKACDQKDEIENMMRKKLRMILGVEIEEEKQSIK